MRTKGDVFDAIYPPEKALVMKIRADLYHAILKAAKGYTQRELQIILQDPQPRVSELLNGKLGGKSLEKLLIYAGRLGIEHRGSFPQVNKGIPKREIELANA
jgi:predicted XRE-type DNA-binding protein